MALHVGAGPIMAGMEAILGALLIFLLRLCDVSLGTLRSLYGGHAYNILAYASGYAAGCFMGITIERWIASGWILVRIITKADALTAAIREPDFGVTQVKGEGRQGEQTLLFIVAPRRRGDELLQLVTSTDASAFVTVDAVDPALGGYLPATRHLEAVRATALRK